MSTLKKSGRNPAGFFRLKRNHYFFLLLLIIAIAVADYVILGLIRRTFVFYSTLDGAVIVEDRMFRSSSSQETDIRRYVEEVLLGSVSPNADPLFDQETQLQSLLLRDGIVYANFNESALIPVFSPEKGVFFSFLILNEGIRRNFSRVKDVRFYIGGREIFSKDFSKIFADSADNNSKTGQ
jgi:hypothetical protein